MSALFVFFIGFQFLAPAAIPNAPSWTEQLEQQSKKVEERMERAETRSQQINGEILKIHGELTKQQVLGNLSETNERLTLKERLKWLQNEHAELQLHIAFLKAEIDRIELELAEEPLKDLGTAH